MPFSGRRSQLRKLLERPRGREFPSGVELDDRQRAERRGCDCGFFGKHHAPSTVTLDSPVTLGALGFNSSQSYTLAGASNLILQTSSGAASINVAAGNHVIGVPVVINSDTVISGAAILDLSAGISGNHTLRVQSTLTAKSVQVDTLMIGGFGATAVPEPSTLVLLALGTIGLLAWPWRRRTT